ncbi:MAG: FeS-binding protein [Candidatus Eisenbacteria sp.]|nr:FeS-binding protein [Candidatus Eisenbacteria bacterium]
MTRSVLPRGLRVLFGLCVAVLAVTGFGQMPIFKRYYLADIPGMGWLAQYYVTHTIHYVAAALFVALLFYFTVSFFRRWHMELRITAWGALRIAAVIIVAVSGMLRVLKNRPDLFFSPEAVFLIDLTHLGAVFLWGVLALGALVARRRPYLTVRKARL